MENILEIKNLSYSYDKKEVLKNINLNIKKASFFVLLGPNGAGKSTIFSLLTRLINIQSGNIKINSHSIKNYSKALKDIGIVFQEATLDLDLSVKQNLIFYGALKGMSKKDTLESIKDEISRLNLQESIDKKVRTLNGGHRRRVEILRALIGEPKILFLDEATVGLDLDSRFEIIEYIRKLKNTRQLSVLWITHLFDEIQEDDELAIIKDGEIIENTLAKDLVEKYDKENLIETFKALTK